MNQTKLNRLSCTAKRRLLVGTLILLKLVPPFVPTHCPVFCSTCYHQCIYSCPQTKNKLCTYILIHIQHLPIRTNVLEFFNQQKIICIMTTFVISVICADGPAMLGAAEPSLGIVMTGAFRTSTSRINNGTSDCTGYKNNHNNGISVIWLPVTHCSFDLKSYINGLIQKICKSSASAIELSLFCINP